MHLAALVHKREKGAGRCWTGWEEAPVCCLDIRESLGNWALAAKTMAFSVVFVKSLI